ncbi:hypothetical protein SISNIDRAFT_492024 [Sistotremastrum niveocremeum HHB9708]|uniref:Uncharacterized protein n=1 Tax=Sistotremastrum niveocremeum HHB9708 TaxID=1314777 RepID=A0A164M4S9_9AGAM|nr:hypothetical protein SISNIDRAFT_492024 [Sistotremastrum niveocremeum HHB9708]
MVFLSTTGGIDYKAHISDEAVLFQAAADRDIMRLLTPFLDHMEEYELLDVLDFSACGWRDVLSRKLADEDRRLLLLCKFADNVILERLRLVNDELRGKLENQLDESANQGLRTLCMENSFIFGEEHEP